MRKNGLFFPRRRVHSLSNKVHPSPFSVWRVGNYEYPFETLLPDDIPESIEGLPGGAIIYKMKAIIERTGLVNKNVVCRKVHLQEFLQSDSSTYE
jgi:hypothetical protein